MKKSVACKKCKRPFRVAYETLYGVTDVAQSAFLSYPCPHCGEKNEVVWTWDSKRAVIPPKQALIR
jgi:hypothetical protein